MKQRYEKHKPGRGGWTEPVHPNMKSYLMQCCDCLLVHEVKFSVVEVGEVRKDGTFDIIGRGKKNQRVQMRMRRDNQKTHAARRQRSGLDQGGTE